MDDAALWADYLSYLRRAPDASGPVALFQGYGHELVAAGVAPDVVAARVTRLAELSRERDDWAAPMFDRIYADERPRFSLAPNEFLVRIAGDLRPGRALDVAMGQGRTASSWPSGLGRHRVRPVHRGPRLGQGRGGGGRAVCARAASSSSRAVPRTPTVHA